MPVGVWNDKEERQYRHILASSGSKRIAAATVNKLRAERGKTQKGDDIDAIASRTTVGKAFKKILKPTQAQADLPRVVGTKQPKLKHAKQKVAPKSSATAPLDEKSGTFKSFTALAGRNPTEETMGKVFENIFKADADSSSEESSMEESSDDEMSKGGFEAASDEESNEDVEKGEQLEECFPCPHCSSDITVSDVEKAMTDGSIHAKGVGSSPKGEKKKGKKIPPRTMAAENPNGGTNHGSAPGAGTVAQSRGVPGAKRENPTASTKATTGGGGIGKSFGGQSPLLHLAKSEGPASDQAMAEEIARMNGVNLEDLK